MNERGTGTTGIAIRVLLLVLVGAPMVAYLWETLNRLFSGHVEPVRLLVSIPIAILFLLLLRTLARLVERWGDVT